MTEKTETLGVTNSLPDYHDHIGLWAGELEAWLPKKIFDAHVHLGVPCPEMFQGCG